MSANDSLTGAMTSRTIRRHVIWNSTITALGGLLFGYDTGVISGALLFISKDFPGLSSTQKELLTSILLLGAMAGGLVAGRIADTIGRRRTVLITAAVFVVGVLLAAFSPSYGVLLVARVIIGLSVGSASVVVPLYIGETAPPKIRGALVSFNQLAITLGILVSYLVDYGLSSSENWRLMFGLAVIPAALMFAGMWFQHESPHWLITRGREDEAREILGQIRAEGDIDSEITEVHDIAAQENQGSYRQLFTPAIRPMVIVGVALAVFQQITGINTLIYYAPTLLSQAGFGSKAALLANVGNGVVNVGLTLVAIWLLDRTGRRPLLLIGTAGMAVGMFVVAITFVAGGDKLQGAGAVVAIAGLLIYTASFAVGLGPVFWLLISEIYPLSVRGRAMSVATLFNWGANFVVTVSFLTLLNKIGNDGTFFLFGGLTVLALLYFWREVPETKDRSLAEIERDITGSTEASSGSATAGHPAPA